LKSLDSLTLKPSAKISTLYFSLPDDIKSYNDKHKPNTEWVEPGGLLKAISDAL